MNRELERLVGFGRLLRAQGLPVGTDRILSFCRAVAVLGPLTKENLYWAARASLISSRDHADVFEGAFRDYFGSSDSDETLSSLGPIEDRASDLRAATLPDDIQSSGTAWSLSEPEEEAQDETALGIFASDVEVLRRKSFEHLSDEERARAAALVRDLTVTLPRRRRRRLEPAPKGSRFDLRRTLRYSLRTQGEPFRRARRGPRFAMRPLVLLLDVSGSMSPYSRALLQFGYAGLAAGQRVEVFCFGTQLTRVTRALTSKDPDRALEDAAEMVHDWEGGTRIGDSLRELLNRYGQRGWMRGAVVVICSDGLERGDPDVLGAEMRRLSRLAHRVVWVNPLKGSPVYEPLARGMAAALPHVDLFLPGHNVESLEALGAALGR